MRSEVSSKSVARGGAPLYMYITVMEAYYCNGIGPIQNLKSEI